MPNELKQLLLGDNSWGYLPLVILRAVVMYVVVLISLRVLGKRGVRQLSIFELVIILTLGSAAGDPMFYSNVGLLTCILVCVIIVTLYRLTIWLSTRVRRFERLLKGRPAYLIQDGKFCLDDFRRQPLAFDEFFCDLRLQNVSQLGQVRTAIMETTGEISIFFFPDEEVKTGLPILPRALASKTHEITEADFYACIKCADHGFLQPGTHACRSCGHTLWVKASNERRIA